jgi:hypothetical protein
VAATIDVYTGGPPGAWTRGTRTELFVQGTQPRGKRQVDPAGLLYSKQCGYGVIQPARAENRGAPASWLAAVNAWAARGGLGTSRWGTRGSIFTLAGKSSFGGRPAPGDSCSGGAARSPSSRGGDRDRGEADEGERDALEDRDRGRGDDRGGVDEGDRGPAPTCRPGTTNKPADCVIPLG